MLVLWEHETTTLRDLGTLLHLDSGTLSPQLQRLERIGLLARSRHGKDGRMLEVVITDAGKELRPRAAAAQQVVEATTGLDQRSLAALRDELNVLADRVRRASGGPNAA